MNNNAEIRTYINPVKIITRADDNESRLVEGYALKFDNLSVDFGWFKEKIDRKALDNADMTDVVALFNHNDNFVLARTISNTLTLTVDDIGLKYSFEAPKTTIGNDLIEMLSRGDIQHSSFSFTVEDQLWEEDENGEEIRTILKINKLFDVSPVTFPAYRETDVSIAKRFYEEQKKPIEKKYLLQESRSRDLQILKAKINSRHNIN